MKSEKNYLGYLKYKNKPCKEIRLIRNWEWNYLLKELNAMRIRIRENERLVKGTNNRNAVRRLLRLIKRNGGGVTT